MSTKSEVTEGRVSNLYRRHGPTGSSVDNSPITNVAGTNIAVTHLTVSAADAAALAGDEIFKGHAHGTFTSGAGAPTDIRFTVFWNGIGGTQLCQLIIPAAGLWANAAGVGWDLDIDISFASPTEAECTIKLWWHTVGGVGGSISWFQVGNATGLSTAGARDITLAYQCTSASTMSLGTKGARIWREA